MKELPNRNKIFHAVVIGASAGGLFALSAIFEKLPIGYPLPILLVQHRSKDQRELLEEILQAKCQLQIKQADEKESIVSGYVYIAPPDYHLLVERDFTLSLSSDAHVKYSRPSIDVLFESAAMVFKESLIGIILTGSSSDGSEGILSIKKMGGLTIAQEPSTAEYPFMPDAAIRTGGVDKIMTLGEIGSLLAKL